MIAELAPNLVSVLSDVQSTLAEVRAELAAVREELKARPLPAPAAREWYTTAQLAEKVGKAEFTVRQWCLEGRVNATKREERRGVSALWKVSADEVSRIEAEGLLEPDRSRNVA